MTEYIAGSLHLFILDRPPTVVEAAHSQKVKSGLDEVVVIWRGERYVLDQIRGGLSSGLSDLRSPRKDCDSQSRVQATTVCRLWDMID